MHQDSFIVGLSRRPFVYGWELRRAIATLAQSLRPMMPDHVQLKVSWESIPTACVNERGHMKLAAVKDEAKVSRALFVRYVGFVLHEALHLMYTDFGPRSGAPYIDRLHNAVEDIWIERRGIANRVTGNIESVLTNLVGQMVEEALAQVTDWADPRQYPFALAIYGRRYAKRVPLANGLEPIFAEASRRIDAADNSHDTLSIAQWVFDQLKNIENQSNPSNDGQGEQGDQGDQGQGDGQGSSGQDVGNAQKASASMDSTEVEPSVGVSPEMGGGNSADDDVSQDGMHLYRHSVYDISINVPARLRYEVRRLFDNSGHTLFTPGRRSGSLNVRSLHRGDDRLFQRRDDVDGIDSAVSILIDRSGSMCGALGDACSVAYALADSLINAEVQVQLITFGSSASVALPWTTNRSKVRDVLSRVGSGGGTNDRGAVRLALESLLARPERRRVIFVLTDGRGFIDDVRGLCQSAKALGVTVIGVGIGCSVSDIYSQAITIKNVSQLGEAVFTQIKLAA